MRKAGVVDYEAFAMEALREARGLPVCLEVIADDMEGMEAQAYSLAGLGPNAIIKIPVTNTEGRSTAGLVKKLSREGLKVNITAVLTAKQMNMALDALPKNAPAIISIFAGRIADTGRDPVPVMEQARTLVRARPQVELLWASPREVLNVYQANKIGVNIITLTADLLAKLNLGGRDLTEYSLDTVKMFYRDAVAAGYALRGSGVAALS